MKIFFSKQEISIMKEFYNSLNEKQKRHYVATETRKLGHGGQVYMAREFRCSRRTIYNGIKEIEKNQITKNRIRKKGGGRKHYYEKHPNIDEKFEKCIKNNTAGNPCGREVKWTNLENKDIVKLLKKEGTQVSVFVVKKLLKKHKYVKRSNLKKKR